MAAGFKSHLLSWYEMVNILLNLILMLFKSVQIINIIPQRSFELKEKPGCWALASNLTFCPFPSTAKKSRQAGQSKVKAKSLSSQLGNTFNNFLNQCEHGMLLHVRNKHFNVDAPRSRNKHFFTAGKKPAWTKLSFPYYVIAVKRGFIPLINMTI